MVDALSLLASAMVQSRQLVEAEALSRRALTLAEKAHGRGDPQTACKHSLLGR